MASKSDTLSEYGPAEVGAALKNLVMPYLVRVKGGQPLVVKMPSILSRIYSCKSQIQDSSKTSFY